MKMGIRSPLNPPPSGAAIGYSVSLKTSAVLHAGHGEDAMSTNEVRFNYKLGNAYCIQ